MKKNTALNLPEVGQDWHRADIIAALKKAGWSVRALAESVGKHPTTIYGALVRPYPSSERVIARALGTTPETIWPQRYAARSFKPALPSKEVA